MGGVAHEMEVQQLGHIACPGLVVFLLKGSAYGSTLLVDEVTLVLGSAARPDVPYKVLQSCMGRHDLLTLVD